LNGIFISFGSILFHSTLFRSASFYYISSIQTKLESSAEEKERICSYDVFRVVLGLFYVFLVVLGHQSWKIPKDLAYLERK
jgi:hypothetical protein